MLIFFLCSFPNPFICMRMRCISAPVSAIITISFAHPRLVTLKRQNNRPKFLFNFLKDASANKFKVMRLNACLSVYLFPLDRPRISFLRFHHCRLLTVKSCKNPKVFTISCHTFKHNVAFDDWLNQMPFLDLCSVHKQNIAVFSRYISFIVWYFSCTKSSITVLDRANFPI